MKKEHNIILNERMNILLKYYYLNGEIVGDIYINSKKIDNFIIEKIGEYIYILFDETGIAKIEECTPQFIEFILNRERKHNKKIVNSKKKCDKLYNNNKCQNNPINNYIKKASNENSNSLFYPKGLIFGCIDPNRETVKNHEKKCRLYNNNEKIENTKNNNYTKEFLEIINLLTDIVTKLTDDKCILINANNIKLLIGKYDFINNLNLNNSIINHIKECLNNIISIISNQKLDILMKIVGKQIEQDKKAFAKEYNMPFDLFAILEGCDYN